MAVVWQLVRFHYMQIIGGTTEDDLVKWANGLVQGEHKIKNLKDKEMSDGHYLLQVCAGIEPRAIDWDIVKKGEEAAAARALSSAWAAAFKAAHGRPPAAQDLDAATQGAGPQGDAARCGFDGELLGAAFRAMRGAPRGAAGGGGGW